MTVCFVWSACVLAAQEIAICSPEDTGGLMLQFVPRGQGDESCLPQKRRSALLPTLNLKEACS